ncbi:hypothetical protein CMI47_04880 [Candidatus Pacearchaeota archaeon]|jgi:hypothetical protein|nr:hypothetical protein [Candidatus Pacearchaeota archaeon]|tara:strand:+ start:1123 stop:2082 length:960 start_codon:yes stop_codon:yes gene_type:complete
MSRKVHIIVGGTYFLEDRVKFFDNKEFTKNKDRFCIERVDWNDVVECKKIPIKGDSVFIFGIKHWVRRLKKKRYGDKKIANIILNFMRKNFKKVPIGVLEDLDLVGSRGVGRKVIKGVISDLNCKIILLREYIKGELYNSKVLPFGICSVNRSGLLKNPDLKMVDFYFRGDSSSRERSRIVSEVRKNKMVNSSLFVYDGGSKSKKKISEKKFFKELANSKICLNVKGNGYSCFRYQEIPSVGSIIATPNYPLITSNDYEDMVSCIKFSSLEDLNKKMNKVLSSKDLASDMSGKSVEVFRRYHTTEKRFLEFMNYLDLVK